MTQRFEIHRKRQLAVEYGLDKVRRQKAQAQDPHDGRFAAVNGEH